VSVSWNAAGRAARVDRSAAGVAVDVGCSAAGRAAEVDSGTAGRAAIIKSDQLQAGAADVCSGSSTVLAAVTIVVKHRARLSVVL